MINMPRINDLWARAFSLQTTENNDNSDNNESIIFDNDESDSNDAFSNIIRNIEDAREVTLSCNGREIGTIDRITEIGYAQTTQLENRLESTIHYPNSIRNTFIDELQQNFSLNAAPFTMRTEYVVLDDNTRLYYKDIEELIQFREKIDKDIRNHFKGK